MSQVEKNPTALKQIAEQFRKMKTIGDERKDEDAAGSLFADAMDNGAFDWCDLLVKARELTADEPGHGWAGFWIIVRQDFLPTVSKNTWRPTGTERSPEYEFYDDRRLAADAIEREASSLDATADDSRSAADAKPVLTDIENAVVLRLKDPTRTDASIAESVGCHPSKLTRSEHYQRAKETVTKALPTLGKKDGDTGEVEGTTRDGRRGKRKPGGTWQEGDRDDQ